MDINEIYTLRDKFSIIGLTGKTGSGCTLFSKIISSPIKYSNRLMLREPEDIEFNESIQSCNVIFKKNTIFVTIILKNMMINMKLFLISQLYFFIQFIILLMKLI